MYLKVDTWDFLCVIKRFCFFCKCAFTKVFFLLSFRIFPVFLVLGQFFGSPLIQKFIFRFLVFGSCIYLLWPRYLFSVFSLQIQKFVRCACWKESEDWYPCRRPNLPYQAYRFQVAVHSSLTSHLSDFIFSVAESLGAMDITFCLSDKLFLLFS